MAGLITTLLMMAHLFGGCGMEMLVIGLSIRKTTNTHFNRLLSNIFSTPGTHGNDLLAGTQAAFVCPDAVTDWNVGTDVHTFVCDATVDDGPALSDADLAKFAARKTGQWQLPAGCDAGTCTESQKTNLATSVSLTVDPSNEDQLLFTSNGIPDHNACSGPPNSAVTAQTYSYTIPRYPALKDGTPDSTWPSTNMGAIGFAINGVPIYNPYDSACCDAGLYELTSLDACYAHPAGTQGSDTNKTATHALLHFN